MAQEAPKTVQKAQKTVQTGPQNRRHGCSENRFVWVPAGVQGSISSGFGLREGWRGTWGGAPSAEACRAPSIDFAEKRGGVARGVEPLALRRAARPALSLFLAD